MHIVYFYDLLSYFSTKVWREVDHDMTLVVGMDSLKIYADVSCCPLRSNLSDPMVTFFNFVSLFMLKLGGAILMIVQLQHTLTDDVWMKELEDASNKEMDLSVLKILNVIKIYIFSRSAPKYLPKSKSENSMVEGDASWSLASEEFAADKQKPDISKAHLFIYIHNLMIKGCPDVHDVIQSRDEMSALLLLGRARTFVHELVHAMRWHTRLIKLDATLDWTRDEDSSWCDGESNFLKIVTPSKFAPHLRSSQQQNPDPADAGRTWEHSLTNGMSIFEGDFFVTVALKKPSEGDGLDDFDVDSKPFDEEDALKILADPIQLVECSRKLAELISKENDCEVVTYVVASRTTRSYPFQCQSSAGWLFNNPQPTGWRQRIAESASGSLESR
jgi:hypothetical protein